LDHSNPHNLSVQKYNLKLAVVRGLYAQDGTTTILGRGSMDAGH
jgi:hypothetical protein